jgi:hypothetical protein
LSAPLESWTVNRSQSVEPYWNVTGAHPVTPDPAVAGEDEF